MIVSSSSLACTKSIKDKLCPYFPDLVPSTSECDVVPRAIPLCLKENYLEPIIEKIKKELNINVSILHFDFARNMLEPQYKKSLVIECGSTETEETIVKVCELIKSYSKN